MSPVKKPAPTKAFYEDNILERKALQTDQNFTLLRRSSVDLSITDGPFAETKEHLGGLLLLDADD